MSALGEMILADEEAAEAETMLADDVLTATAYHEAGHAVVAFYQHNMIRERGVSINEDGTGQTHSRKRVLGYKYLLAGGDELPAHFRQTFYRDIQKDMAESQAGLVAENLYMKAHRKTARPLYTRENIALLVACSCEVTMESLPPQPMDEDTAFWLAWERWRALHFTRSDWDAHWDHSYEYDRLNDDVNDSVIKTCLWTQRRLIKLLEHTEVWSAVEIIATLLLEQRSLTWEDANWLLESSGCPTMTKPF